jgi:hypothetical protein
MCIEEGEKIQTEGIDNLFNNIKAENVPNLDKRKDIGYRRLSKHQPCSIRKEALIDIL